MIKIAIEKDEFKYCPKCGLYTTFDFFQFGCGSCGFDKFIDYGKNSPYKLSSKKEKYVPYFGWCDVKGCKNEGCSGGNAWRETGYWTVCTKHSVMYMEGKEQPEMKINSIKREKRRGIDGVLRK
jgi:hypothetical protein